jgi:hypothetical protein
MTDSHPQERYRWLIEEAARAGRIDPPPAGEEHRAHPRFKLDGTELSIDVRLVVSAIAISLSGVSFFANHPFTHGQQFAMSIGEVFDITCEVVDCALEQTDDDLLETRYRVRGRFVNQELELDQLLRIIER